MIVDLEEKTERGTFDLGGGGKVHLRLMTATDIKEITKATMTTSPEYVLLEDPETKKKEYKRFEGQKFNVDLFDEMKWDRIIEGWDNVLDKDEKPIPVSSENKTLLMTRVPDFAKAVNDGLKALKKEEEKKQKAAEKNS